VREEELDRQFLASLEAIKIDEDVIAWLVQALKHSHEDEQCYHEERLASLQQSHQKLENRLRSMYIDKLDGKITQDFYEAQSSGWRKEQIELQRKIEQHQNANREYIENGVRLLELSQHAAILYKKQTMAEKRQILKCVHSNSSWKDGQLTTNYRKPFDLLAVTNIQYKEKRAASSMESDPRSLWLPEEDENENWEVGLNVALS